jgi:hypothetical protein
MRINEKYHWMAHPFLSIVVAAVCQSHPSAETSRFLLTGNDTTSLVSHWPSSPTDVLGEVVMTSMAMVQSRKTNPSSGGGGGRRKRDIFHLYNMMSCTTQCDPLSYKGYGCYCGFLGSGLTVDAIDRFCSLIIYYLKA